MAALQTALPSQIDAVMVVDTKTLMRPPATQHGSGGGPNATNTTDPFRILEAAVAVDISAGRRDHTIRIWRRKIHLCGYVRNCC